MNFKKLSTVLDSVRVHANKKGYLFFRAEGKNNVRKLTVKPFSNFPLVTVRFNNEIYLVDESMLLEVTSEEYFK